MPWRFIAQFLTVCCTLGVSLAAVQASWNPIKVGITAVAGALSLCLLLQRQCSSKSRIKRSSSLLPSVPSSKKEGHFHLQAAGLVPLVNVSDGEEMDTFERVMLNQVPVLVTACARAALRSPFPRRL